MKARRKIKTVLIAAGVILIVLALSIPALAQCAMCKTGLAGSPEAKKLAESLNLAVIVLLIPPVMIFCGIFLAAFRRMRKSDETERTLPK
jgi:uncharacterized membrane protein